MLLVKKKDARHCEGAKRPKQSPRSKEIASPSLPVNGIQCTGRSGSQ